jgi:hypothetical protein
MKVLIVTSMEGAENCVAALSKLLNLECELAEGRKSALLALKRSEYAVVVVDEGIADSDEAGAEMIWQQTGLAIPVQVNFALSGAQRLAREVKSALYRRERELALAHDAAAAAIETELKTTVAGLLLHSQLALADREVSAPLVAELVGSLRQQLAPSSPSQTRV